jgi:hypothetical protein
MTETVSVWTYFWMLFILLGFLLLGFAMGWNARGIKEIDKRFKKADDTINEQIKAFEEGMKKCSRIFSENASSDCKVSCEKKDDNTTGTTII